MNDVVLCFQLHFTTREHCFGVSNLKAGEAHVPLLSEEGFDRLRMSAYLSVRFWRVNSLKCQLDLPLLDDKGRRKGGYEDFS